MLAPLNGLRAFEAVARHESFTRAAQELAVSQSAVSHQIRNLESFLRTRLFERSGLTLALTQEGQTLHAGLRQAFALIRQSVADVQAEVEASPLGISLKPHFA
ncbi:MAG: LysR family transcriptional regulator, partial [Kiloniellales bacterium]